MKTKYNIHPDFKKWSKFNPPLNRFVLFFVQKTMNLFFHKPKTDKECIVKKLSIPNGSNKPMRALLFSPTGIQKDSPCLIYYHGGGFVMPGAPYHYRNAKRYAVKAKCKVLFVDYPIAPKHKFPEPVNACFNTYKWAIENATYLSINKHLVAVGGDSAGGNLASVVSMMAFDNKIITPCAQMLIYPAIGSETKTESMKKYNDTPMCNSKDYEKYCKLYFKSNQDKKEKYISAVKASSFNIFPPTYIETAEFDCLKDEAILFAEQLKKAKIDVQLNNTIGTIHGYDIVEDSKITQDNLIKRIDFLKKHFSKNKKA